MANYKLIYFLLVLVMLLAVLFLASSRSLPVFSQTPMHQQVQEKIQEVEEKTKKAQPQEDIIEVVPQGQFLHPQEGMKLQKDVKIKFQVSQALSVKFYTRRPETLSEIYLGQANLLGQDTWEYSWQTTFTPNGRHFLLAQITNEYGEYPGQRILVEIENKIKKDEPKIEALKEEVKKVEEKEVEVQEKEEAIKGDIKKQIEEMGEKAKELIKEEEKEIAVPEVAKKEKELSQKVEEELEQAFEEEKPEKIEEIEKDVEEELEEIPESVKEEEEKEKAQQIATETEQEIKESFKKARDLLASKQEIKVQKDELMTRDSDDEGLPDYQELELGSDPFNPDTSGDGFLDSYTVKLGFDPIIPSPAPLMKSQDPLKVSPPISEVLKVEKVEIVQIEGKEKLKITGKALPNSFVTLYIYSLPVIVVTRADIDGNWEYVLDKPLVDGQHRVYATYRNNQGKIVESSEAFIFTKRGAKIVRLLESREEAVSPIKALQRSFAILVVSIIIFTLGLAFMIIGFMLSRGTSK